MISRVGARLYHDIFHQKVFVLISNKNHSEWPQDSERYVFKRLALSERSVISLVYFRMWRRLVSVKALRSNERAYFKLYLKEIHARYYLKVIRGPSYVKVSRLILNFLISKANENIRAILLSLEPYNLTIFVHAIRSQVELNALLQKYIDNFDYHRKYITLNEDRSKVKEKETVININTLVSKMGDTPLPYSSSYNKLSLLLHPNPSAIKFYAQAEGKPTPSGTGIFQPKIKHYFDETITPTEIYNEWFRENIWLFLGFVEHYLVLIDSLENDFFVGDIEEEQFSAFGLAQLVSVHQKEILKAANSASINGEDIGRAVNKIIQDIINGKNDDING